MKKIMKVILVKGADKKINETAKKILSRKPGLEFIEEISGKGILRGAKLPLVKTADGRTIQMMHYGIRGLKEFVDYLCAM